MATRATTTNVLPHAPQHQPPQPTHTPARPAPSPPRQPQAPHPSGPRNPSISRSRSLSRQRRSSRNRPGGSSDPTSRSGIQTDHTWRSQPCALADAGFVDAILGAGIHVHAEHLHAGLQPGRHAHAGQPLALPRRPPVRRRGALPLLLGSRHDTCRSCRDTERSTTPSQFVE